jgi:hypothetical protein
MSLPDALQMSRLLSGLFTSKQVDPPQNSASPRSKHRKRREPALGYSPPIRSVLRSRRRGLDLPCEEAIPKTSWAGLWSIL